MWTGIMGTKQKNNSLLTWFIPNCAILNLKLYFLFCNIYTIDLSQWQATSTLDFKLPFSGADQSILMSSFKFSMSQLILLILLLKGTG